ncbi:MULTISPECIES: hypothetical protein [Pseudomonas]|uniref:hypothetical protein n=1 Tax=Pseudomonas TaxID=286 RepID=UPI000761CBCC|nr:hypothetical protein [Pseudomonas sp. NBRC 111136]
MAYTLIDIGKQPEEPFNVVLALPLPADTPFGNFQLKWMDMVLRLNEVNRQIIISHDMWVAFMNDGLAAALTDAVNKHKYATEYAVTGMRRVADEFVALISCLDHHAKNREYPTRVPLEKIGLTFNDNQNGPDELFKRHRPLLRMLNDLSNTLKHSFLQSDLAIIGAEGPQVNALELKSGDLSKGYRFHTVSLNEITHLYNQFFHDCREWLRSLQS